MIVSSISIISPTFFDQEIIVASETLSPILGIIRSTLAISLIIFGKNSKSNVSKNYFDKEFSYGNLLLMAVPKVISSAYSNSSPIEIPLAIEEIVIFRSFNLLNK